MTGRADGAVVVRPVANPPARIHACASGSATAPRPHTISATEEVLQGMRTLFWTAVFLLDREHGGRPGPGYLVLATGGVVTAIVVVLAGAGR
jgi:hypothetical protein